jgi:hypothetical protein
MDNSELILNELRDLRSAFNDNAQSTGERLASLETSMYALIGNGQPGRIAVLETAVDKLREWRWKVIGASAGVSGAVSGLVMLIRELLR